MDGSRRNENAVTAKAAVRCARIVTLCCLAALAPVASATSGTVVITDIEIIDFGAGLRSIDSGVVHLGHGTFSARASADDGTGILRAYAATTQIQPETAISPTAAIAEASVRGTLTLTGPGASPVGFTIAMDLDGKFLGDYALNALQGQIHASHTGPLVTNTWTSNLSFEDVPELPILVLQTSFRNFGTAPFPEGTPIVHSFELEALSGRVLMPLSLIPGEKVELVVSLTVSSQSYATLSGNAEGTFDGIVDAYSTGRMLFSLPPGYSLVGEDGAFASVAVVPEAETYALMLAGLGLVGYAARRRTRA